MGWGHSPTSLTLMSNSQQYSYVQEILKGYLFLQKHLPNLFEPHRGGQKIMLWCTFWWMCIKSSAGTPAAVPRFRSVLLLFQTTQRKEKSWHPVVPSMVRCQSGFQSVSCLRPYRVQGVVGPHLFPLSGSFKVNWWRHMIRANPKQ